MKKLILTTCKICGKTSSPRGFSFHISQSHNISIEDYILKYELNNELPKCQCGCGEIVTIRNYYIMDYKNRHCPTAGFQTGAPVKRGDPEKYKVNLKKGINNYHEKMKNENPLYNSGKNNNFYNKRHSVKTKELIKKKVNEQIKSGNHAFIGKFSLRAKKTKLEIKFEKHLQEKNLNYEYNFRISYLNKEGHLRYKYYDFYIKDFNLLIETHGNYWHPRENNENLPEIQKKNFQNDIFKKELAKKNNYQLLSIFEDELDYFIETGKLTSLLEVEV